MTLKIAIVGCGKIADAHVEEIRKIPSVQLGAVCDLDPITERVNEYETGGFIV